MVIFYVLFYNLQVCENVLFNLFQDENSPWHLSFFVGESLIILEECRDWYFGHSISNSALCGVFPKSYVFLVSNLFIDCRQEH